MRRRTNRRLGDQFDGEPPTVTDVKASTVRIPRRTGIELLVMASISIACGCTRRQERAAARADARESPFSSDGRFVLSRDLRWWLPDANEIQTVGAECYNHTLAGNVPSFTIPSSHVPEILKWLRPPLVDKHIDLADQELGRLQLWTKSRLVGNGSLLLGPMSISWYSPNSARPGFSFSFNGARCRREEQVIDPARNDSRVFDQLIRNIWAEVRGSGK